MLVIALFSLISGLGGKKGPRLERLAPAKKGAIAPPGVHEVQIAPPGVHEVLPEGYGVLVPHQTADGPTDGSVGVSSVTSSTEVGYSQECNLLSAYGTWKRSCLKKQAFKPVPECTEAMSDVDTCIEKNIVGDTSWTFYSTKTQTTTDTSEFLGLMMGAEGTGWGAQMSASTKFVQSKSKTSNQVGFYIGMSGDVFRNEVRNPQGLELTDSAKTMLAEDWNLFKVVYGTAFVRQITYSSSYVGSAAVTVHQDRWKRELETAASISINDFWNAGLHSSVERSITQSKDKIKFDVKSQFTGSMQEIEEKEFSDTVKLVKQQFATWTRNVINKPDEFSEASRMIFERLINNEEVMSVIQANYDGQEIRDILEAFQYELPTGTVIETFTREYFWTGTQIDTLVVYVNDDCVKGDADLDAKVRQFTKDLRAHKTQMEDMDETLLGDLIKQIKAGNFDWFISLDQKHTREIEREIASKCPVQTPVLRPDTYYTLCSAGSSSGNCAHADSSTNDGAWVKYHNGHYYASVTRQSRFQLYPTDAEDDNVFKICADHGSSTKCLHGGNGSQGTWITMRHSDSGSATWWKMRLANGNDLETFTICMHSNLSQCIHGDNGSENGKYLRLWGSHDYNKNRGNGRFRFTAENKYVGITWPQYW